VAANFSSDVVGKIPWKKWGDLRRDLVAVAEHRHLEIWGTAVPLTSQSALEILHSQGGYVLGEFQHPGGKRMQIWSV
jgi:hypothetical protein